MEAAVEQKVGRVWRAAAQKLTSAGFDEAVRDAQILLMHMCAMDSLALISRENDLLTAEDLIKYDRLIARRLLHVPVARIIGHQEFYGLKFGLNNDTLIPRPETEMLVDEGISLFKSHENPLIADLGTGSGAILISLLANLPNARGTGFDLSARALNMAEENMATHELGMRCGFIKSDWFSSFAQTDAYDLIVSNPPYIVSSVVPQLQVDVKDYDPALALDGGRDGLDAYREIVGKAGNYLKPDGWLLLEIGYDQGAALTSLCGSARFKNIEILKDLSGQDRVVKAQYAAQIGD